MPIVPSSRLGKIEFYEAHLTPWQTNATPIGLNTQEITNLTNFITAARDAYNLHQVALDASKAATEAFYNAVAELQADGANLIRTIKNKAEVAQDPNIYVLAAIPAPAAPTPMPPPGTPTDLKVELLQSGAIVLSWKCPNPTGSVGTIYEVQRRLGTSPTAPFEFAGATGVRNFTDESLPLGPTSVTYRITGIRSTTRGNPGQFLLTFGGSGGDGLTVTSQAARESALQTGGYSIDIPAPSGNGNATRRGMTRV